MQGRDSQIRIVTPDMAASAPMKRMDMVARSTEMMNPHHGKVELLW